MKLWRIGTAKYNEEGRPDVFNQVVAAETEEEAFKLAFLSDIEYLGEADQSVKEGCISPNRTYIVGKVKQ